MKIGSNISYFKNKLFRLVGLISKLCHKELQQLYQEDNKPLGVLWNSISKYLYFNYHPGVNNRLFHNERKKYIVTKIQYNYLYLLQFQHPSTEVEVEIEVVVVIVETVALAQYTPDDIFTSLVLTRIPWNGMVDLDKYTVCIRIGETRH